LPAGSPQIADITIREAISGVLVTDVVETRHHPIDHNAPRSQNRPFWQPVGSIYPGSFGQRLTKPSLTKSG
jgi:hypothetical protein